jgi:hypothetical protein
MFIHKYRCIDHFETYIEVKKFISLERARGVSRAGHLWCRLPIQSEVRLVRAMSDNIKFNQHGMPSEGPFAQVF